ncbi:sapC family protein [Asticcacaulis biprosthecium C19]|uniref:SapC family protein n=1 Tax=Asticcacaulis biprosthecium C19 TaxID=715226 RepID=F4QLP4_9CAUL|nr:SapC family protein [Asticcacaulis biprosthecium]EGF93542.1 sapC family protein [Asticcacaulis biprosthecium C19]
MPNAVALDNVQHHNLKVRPGYGALYGDAINEVAIFANEFADAQRDYPIYFRRDDRGGLQAYALLGLDKGENLFLDGTDWKASYIPAMQARGPFMIGFREREEAGEVKREPTMAINLDDPRVSRDDGHALFLPQGGNAPQLERHALALRTIHTGVDASRGMFNAFIQAGLVAAVQIEVKLDDTTEYNIPEIFSISQEALGKLEGAALERLNKQGYLGLAYYAIASLSNVRRIIAMKNQRRAAQE